MCDGIKNSAVTARCENNAAFTTATAANNIIIT